MSKPSKRHHYLPQCYLRRFTGDDGLLCIFDREAKTLRRQHPVNTALEKHFYSITDSAGRRSDGLEFALSQLENTASGVIKRLDARETGWVDENELFAFAMFIALLYTRTPIFHKEQVALGEWMFRSAAKAEHSSPEVIAEWFKKFEEETEGSMEGISPERFFQVVQNDEYDLEVPREYTIRLMLDLTEHVATVLQGLTWHFVQSPPDLAFITSDGPFLTAPPPGVENNWRAYGILTPGATSMIPLSPSTCLVLTGEGPDFRYGRVNKDTARTINANVAQNSDRFIVGRDEAYLRKLVVRTGVDRYRWTSRFEFKSSEIDADLLFHAKRTRPVER